MATRREILPLDQFLSYRLHQVSKVTDRASIDAYAQELGLAVGEARCLAAIGNFAPVSVNQLAAKANLDKGQASRAAQALVDRGLVSKDISASDARGVELKPTAEGRRLWTRVMRLIEEPRAVVRADETGAAASLPQSPRCSSQRQRDDSTTGWRWP